MKARIPFMAGLLAGLVLGLSGSPIALGAQGPAADSGPVRIQLKSDAEVDDIVVTLDQISQLRGGPDSLRKRLAKIDISEFKLVATSTTIPAEQVGFRLLLAGVNADRFELAGPAARWFGKATLPSHCAGRSRRGASPAGPVSRRRLKHGVHRFSWSDASDRGVARQARTPGGATKHSVSASGNARVDVAVTVGGKIREVVPVYFDVAPLELAGRGDFVDSSGPRTAHFTTPRNAPPGTTMGGPPPLALIKARDSVKLVANVGAADRSHWRGPPGWKRRRSHSCARCGIESRRPWTGSGRRHCFGGLLTCGELHGRFLFLLEVLSPRIGRADALGPA